MLEVCFNNSVQGALSLAQSCGRSYAVVSAVSIGLIPGKENKIRSFFMKRKALHGYKKRRAKLQKLAVPLDSKREDIVGLSFLLSEGDILSPICPGDCLRKDYIRSIFSFDRYGEGGDTETHINDFWKNCIEDLQKLKSNPPQIRIWLDNTPDAQCGLLFVADLLRDSATKIHVVELPKKLTREDKTVIEYRGWGEVEPELYGTFLDKERVLSEKESKELAEKWILLQKENAPLRVVENNSVISTDISYYDDLIKKEFPKDSCKIGQIISNFLLKQTVQMGDVFIAKRIRHFIENGELIMLEGDIECFYNAIVSCPI